MNVGKSNLFKDVGIIIYYIKVCLLLEYVFLVRGGIFKYFIEGLYRV